MNPFRERDGTASDEASLERQQIVRGAFGQWPWASENLAEQLSAAQRNHQSAVITLRQALAFLELGENRRARDAILIYFGRR